ncbi:MAG: ribosome-associated translation inhibitor RaiA [Thermaceae bacterium]|nr:ribosome-associated translation inhibitor RaiA [Thermaceae bacterium]
MNVYKLVGRQVEITEALKSYLDKKMPRLDRHFEGADTKIVLSMAQGSRIEQRAKAEIQVSVPKGLVRVEESDSDMYAAIDRAIDRLEYQLRRYKDRHFHSTRQPAPEPVLAGVSPTEESEEDVLRIVRVKRFAVKPMSPEDAAFEMEALGHDFFMFRNGESDEINVIYRRRDGNYGLIEPSV